jgi:ribosomal protein S27AE
MILHRVCKPIHSMCEHPTCPRCGQPILVAEIDDHNPTISNRLWLK